MCVEEIHSLHSFFRVHSASFWISMYYSDNANGNARSFGVVGLNSYGIGIGATCGLQVFHPENAAANTGTAFLNQLTTNEFIS